MHKKLCNGESSFITRKTGHTPLPVERISATPSVLPRSDMLESLARKPPGPEKS